MPPPRSSFFPNHRLTSIKSSQNHTQESWRRETLCGEQCQVGDPQSQAGRHKQSVITWSKAPGVESTVTTFQNGLDKVKVLFWKNIKFLLQDLLSYIQHVWLATKIIIHTKTKGQKSLKSMQSSKPDSDRRCGNRRQSKITSRPPSHQKQNNLK